MKNTSGFSDLPDDSNPEIWQGLKIVIHFNQIIGQKWLKLFKNWGKHFKSDKKIDPKYVKSISKYNMAFFEDFEQGQKDQDYAKRCAILSHRTFLVWGVDLSLSEVFQEATEQGWKTFSL